LAVFAGQNCPPPLFFRGVFGPGSTPLDHPGTTEERDHLKLLDALERPFYAAVRPLVDWLIRSGIKPNTITTFGTGLVLLSAVAYGVGAIRVGGLLLLLSGVVDTLDGQVARDGAMVTKFGAFYDSTLDRIGDGATFIGIGAFLLTAPDVAFRGQAVVTCMVAILASLLVSYARARAEGLGIECKVGIAQRAERIVLLGGASLLVGPGPHAFVLEAIVALLTVASIITVVQRFVYVHQHAEGRSPGVAVRAADAAPKARALDTIAKGS
jgi:CDP-diacylglycerol--glycerol-3-phosphate 3-phosphatidyltransferase